MREWGDCKYIHLKVPSNTLLRENTEYNTHTHTLDSHNTITTYSIESIFYQQVYYSTIVGEPLVDAGDNGGGECLDISNKRGAENIK